MHDSSHVDEKTLFESGDVFFILYSRIHDVDNDKSSSTRSIRPMKVGTLARQLDDSTRSHLSITVQLTPTRMRI